MYARILIFYFYDTRMTIPTWDHFSGRGLIPAGLIFSLLCQLLAQVLLNHLFDLSFSNGLLLVVLLVLSRARRGAHKSLPSILVELGSVAVRGGLLSLLSVLGRGLVVEGGEAGKLLGVRLLDLVNHARSDEAAVVLVRIVEVRVWVAHWFLVILVPLYSSIADSSGGVPVALYNLPIKANHREQLTNTL